MYPINIKMGKFEVNINAEHNKGFMWCKRNNCLVKGYLYDERNTLYKDEKIVDYLNTNTSSNDENLHYKLRTANGSFALIIQTEKAVYIAVDRLRSIPIFYGHKDERIFISDNAYWIQGQVEDYYIDTVSEGEFLKSGYVVGQNTLYSSIKQIQTSEYLTVTENGIYLQRYFLHTHGNYLIEGQEGYFSKLEGISKNIFERLIESVQNKCIVIPLSGGYDSRYIATMLARLGYRNVICYTYGRQSSFEVEISKKVARKLGYTWYFIEYTDRKWESYFESDDVHNYHLYSFNLASLPHVQEYIALKELFDRELVPKDAVFVPGFCGDLFGGSYLPSEYRCNKKDLKSSNLVDYIFRKQFYLNNSIIPETEKLIRYHISETLSGFPRVNDADNFVSVNEAWFTDHKVAKFVVNAVRPYEFFGYEWRMPLWDNELMEFWYRIPNVQRFCDKLYDRYLLDRIFAPFNVGYKKEERFGALKRIIPPSTVEMGRRILPSFRQSKKLKDINAFEVLTSLCLNDLPNYNLDEQPITHVNQVFAKWFLSKISPPLS